MRSSGTVGGYEDNSLDLVLELNPWDNDVISSLRDGLSVTQRTNDLDLQRSARSSLLETVTPSPRPGDLRPSFWEESSPSELSLAEKKLCLSPASDSGSPSNIDYRDLSFRST